MYEGYEEIACAKQREVNEVWETFEVEVEQLFEGERAVVAFTHERGRGVSGVDVDRRTAFLFRLADGKISEVRVCYRDRERALADLGLAPEGRTGRPSSTSLLQRRIRSSGQLTTISRFAQGWHVLQTPLCASNFADRLGEPGPRAVDLRGLGARRFQLDRLGQSRR